MFIEQPFHARNHFAVSFLTKLSVQGSARVVLLRGGQLGTPHSRGKWLLLTLSVWCVCVHVGGCRHTLGSDTRSSCSRSTFLTEPYPWLQMTFFFERGMNFTIPIWRDFESQALLKGLKILIQKLQGPESYNELCSVCNSGGCKGEQRLSGWGLISKILKLAERRVMDVEVPTLKVKACCRLPV